MKKIFSLLLCTFVLSQISTAQIRSVTAFTDYSIGLSKRLQITSADAAGGGVKIRYSISDNLNLGITGGYKLYSLNEADVLNTWGWEFWTERYYNKIVSDLQADPNLSVEIGAVQKMDLIPFMLFVEYEIELFEDLRITPVIGGGVYFYTRRMYATENWSKNFPDADYLFTYSYRNFAPVKTGNPLFVNTGLDFEYSLSGAAGIYSGINFNFIMPAEGSMGYDAFPFENEITFKVGLVIFY